MKLRRLQYHSHNDGTVQAGCNDCREKFEQSESVCGFCTRNVSNRNYFRNDFHQSGKCRAFLRFKMPERSVDKPLPHPSDNPALRHVDYEKVTYGFGMHVESTAQLAEWWGLRPRK